MDKWNKAQEWEREWHGNCVNTTAEEIKQLEYAKLMGVEVVSKDGKLVIDRDVSVIDIGGGASSLLLKLQTNKKKVVIDPIQYPNWCIERYKTAGIEFVNIKGEDISDVGKFDECWIYNCLQHVDDPKKIIENAKRLAKVVRIFEWIDIPENIGHIHILTDLKLDLWLGKQGKTRIMDENGCNGKAYFNIINYEQI